MEQSLNEKQKVETCDAASRNANSMNMTGTLSAMGVLSRGKKIDQSTKQKYIQDWGESKDAACI